MGSTCGKLAAAQPRPAGLAASVAAPQAGAQARAPSRWGRDQRAELPANRPRPDPRASRVADVEAFDGLSNKGLSHVADFLRPADQASLSLASHGAHLAVGPQLRLRGQQRAGIEGGAAMVHDLQSFNRILGQADAAVADEPSSIAELRPDLRARPLQTLLERIPQLARAERPQAAAAFRAALAALDDEFRVPALMTIDRIAGHPDASDAAGAGENVALAAAVFGVGDDDQIAAIEMAAARGVAGHAVRNGANVQSVARQHGIEMPNTILSLELQAINGGVAGRAAQQAGNVQAIARDHGISTPEALTALERRALVARAASPVYAGVTVRDIAQDLGIENPGNLRVLERIVVQGPALAAVLAGEDQEAVVLRLGIEREASVALLQRLAQTYAT